MPQVSLQEALYKYLNYICFSGRYTTNTCTNYVSDLNQLFEAHIFGKFIYKPPEHLSFSKNELKNGSPTEVSLSTQVLDEVFNKFKPYLSGLSALSRKRKVSSFKGFTSWCMDSEWIESDPGLQISSIKTPERLPHYLNLDEVMAYFSSLRKDYQEKPEAYWKEWLSFLFLYGCGLRVSEACHIQTKNIDLEQHRILILGKGKKERFAILPEFTLKSIEKAHQQAKEEAFAYIYGKKPLVARTVFNWVKKRALKAGLHKPVHPHIFRHSYATHLLREKTDLRHLQELLGHSSLTSTQTYAHLDRDQLLQNLENFHPLSNKFKD